MCPDEAVERKYYELPDGYDDNLGEGEQLSCIRVYDKEKEKKDAKNGGSGNDDSSNQGVWMNFSLGVV